MKMRMRLLLCAAMNLAVVMIGASARATDPTTADCLAASERSLSLRGQHKLRAARGALLVCAAASCPADVRDECVRRVADVNVAIPTIVFEARDPSGSDTGAVEVTLDDELLANRLEGVALSIDPGLHTFVFTIQGQPPLQKQFLIREGEKDRRELITFARVIAEAAAPPPAVQQPPPVVQTPVPSVQLAAPTVTSPAPVVRPLPATPPQASDEPPSSGLGGQRIAALAAGVVGVAGVGFGVGFGLDALSKRDDAKRVCPSQCVDQHGVDLWNQARTAGSVSTVAFIVGAAGLAGGAALWLTAKPDAPEPRVAVKLYVGPRAAQFVGTW